LKRFEELSDRDNSFSRAVGVSKSVARFIGLLDTYVPAYTDRKDAQLSSK